MGVTEYNYLLSSSSDSDIEKFSDGDALGNRINEWLETPVGTIADWPEWGNNLNAFKFEPQGINLEVAMELAIVEKLGNDVKDLIFVGVSVEFIEIDLFVVTIRHQFGDTVKQLEL